MPALNRTLLNGQAVASGDWFMSEQQGRTFNYSLLAPQIIHKVEVYKSPEAHGWTKVRHRWHGECASRASRWNWRSADAERGR